MKAYRVRIVLGLGLVLLLTAGASLLPANHPVAAIVPQDDYPRLIEIASDDTGILFQLSGDGRWIVYRLIRGTSDSDDEVYIADTSGTSPPQRLPEDIMVTDINEDGSIIVGIGISDDNLGHIFVNGQDVTPCQYHYALPPLCLTTGHPHVSGDGKTLYFVSDKRWGCQAKRDEVGNWYWDWKTCKVNSSVSRPYPYTILWKMSVSGGNPTVVLDDLLDDLDAYHIVDVSRNGAVLMMRYLGAGGEYYLIQGANKIPVDPPPRALSGDGRYVARGIVTGREIYVTDLTNNTSTVVPVPNTMVCRDSSLIRLNQDASYLLTPCDAGSTDPEGIWRVRVSNADFIRITIPGHEHDLDYYPLYSDPIGLSYSGETAAFVDETTRPYILYVWKGAVRPDLAVDDFHLDPDSIVYQNGRYVLPVDVVVRNKGETDITEDVTVRFSDNSGWSETRTIAGLAIGVTQTLHLDWDLTDLLLAGDGQATVRLTVAADPDDTIAELNDLNNIASASLDVDVRPRITAVQPTFTLDRAYFLDNETVDNPVKVYVDWNGDLTGEGDPPYGDVYFDLNGQQVRKDGQQWGAEHTYDMGSDFQSAFSCANNTLRIWATYPVDGHEFQSLETLIQPTVFPWPGWVEWAIQNIPGSDASFEVEPKPPLVRYTYDFKYPEEPFEANWTPPQWVPYLGGTRIGILPTQAGAEAEAQSDGAGTAEVSGETGLGLAKFDVEGNIYGKGETRFVCGESFDLQRAELGLEIRAPIEKEIKLVKAIPALKAAENWPVVGRIIRWVNNIAKLKGSFTPAIEIVTEFEERENQLEFVQGTGTGSIDAGAELSVEPCEGLSAGAYGGGKPYITLQVPKNPGYLQKVGIQLYYGAGFKAWAFEAEYERKVDCSYPGICQEVIEEEEGLMAAASEPAWHLIPRTYAGPDYALAAAYPLLVGGGTGVRSAATTSTTLLTNIYPRPEPALALRSDGRRLLAYVHDDTAKPHGRGTEIYSLYWNGSAWSGPTRLTDDEQPDFAPSVAYDGSGMGVLLWERSTLPAGITPTLDITFAQSLEIAAATWNGSSWSTPVTLTNDSLMDTAPQLSAASDGSVMALWKTSDGADILGTATHPLTLTYAIWNGSAWGSPAAALTGLHDVIDVAFAARSSTQAALVYVVDADGVLSTTHDSDLYYSTFDGTSWSSPTALATDAITDTSPALAYDASGDLHLLWLRDGDLVWLKNSWDVNAARTVRSTSTEGGFLGFTLSSAADGNLALVWQGMDADGADLTYAVYDAAADSWSADLTLTSGADVEADHAPAFGDDGNFYAAYRRIETQFVTRTFTISPTHSFTVTNLPQEGQSDLVFLSHTVGRDLTFDSLTITPTNPAPGQNATLTAILRNGGDLAVTSPQVAFYDGASQIGSTQTLPTLAAGYTATVTTTWAVPSPVAAHTLKALADPAGAVPETDETDNEITLQTTLPDLRVDLLTTDYSTTTLTATVRLVNDGVLAAAAPFTVALRAADPLTGTLLGTVPVTDDLAAGGEVTVTLALTDPLSLAGLGTQLWAIADEGDAVAEADEGNNTAYGFLPLLPDLTLTAADITGYGPVLVTLHNRGIVTATAPVLTARSGGLSGTLLYSGTLSDLGPGGTVTATLNLSPGAFSLWVKADPENLIAEGNEGNNLAVRAVEVPHRVYLPLVVRNR